MSLSLKTNRLRPFESSRSKAEIKTLDAHNYGLGGPTVCPNVVRNRIAVVRKAPFAPKITELWNE